MSVNKVILVGNVGNDPEIKDVNGTKLAQFPLATNESYTNKNGEKVDNTEWHNIKIWRNLADIVEKFVKKGSQLYVEGKIKTRTYDDKDGIKRYATEIIADSIRMIGSKPNVTVSNTSAPAQGDVEGDNGDLPF